MFGQLILKGVCFQNVANKIRYENIQPQFDSEFLKSFGKVGSEH